MASGWVKSFQCKSRAYDDVHHLSASAGCRTIRDVIETAKPRQKKSKVPVLEPPLKPLRKSSRTESDWENRSRDRFNGLTRPPRAPDSLLPALTELPEGHSSRNVVEIIFHTSWSPKAFSGRIEMIFKVQNGSKIVARFEEYREIVKKQSGSGGSVTGDWEENARCAADGNEVMQFQCLRSTGGGSTYDSRSGGAWEFGGGKDAAAVRTFSSSGEAHESAGGGRGRRAMVVCRVIAGRVSKHAGIDSSFGGRVGFDSVSGDNDELLIFDSRALLPCFLIIYKV